MLDSIPKPDDPDQTQPKGMPCIVVGGCANGVLLESVLINAEFIELARPIGLKPLASAIQKMPEIVNESDQYEVHPVGLHRTKSKVDIFGIAVIRGRSLTWAFKQLLTGYVKHTTNEMLAAGIITKQ